MVRVGTICAVGKYTTVVAPSVVKTPYNGPSSMPARAATEAERPQVIPVQKEVLIPQASAARGSIAAPLMAAQVRKSTNRNLQLLKSILEKPEPQ